MFKIKHISYNTISIEHTDVNDLSASISVSNAA